MATSPKKRMRVLPSLRIGELLENALMRPAARDDRPPSDYVRKVLENHCFGHARSLDADSQMFNDADAMHGRTTGHGHLTER